MIVLCFNDFFMNCHWGPPGGSENGNTDGWMDGDSVNIFHQDIKALNRDSSPTEPAFDDLELICTGSANAAYRTS